MEPAEFEMRYIDSLLPSESWEQTGTIAAACHNAIVAAHGGEFRRPDHFIPTVSFSSQERDDQRRIESEQQHAAAAFTPKPPGVR